MKDKEKVDDLNGLKKYYNRHINKTIKTNLLIILISTYI